MLRDKIIAFSIASCLILSALLVKKKIFARRIKAELDRQREQEEEIAGDKPESENDDE